MGKGRRTHCFCGDLLTFRTSSTVMNPNRRFISCPSRRCKFFEWIDEEDMAGAQSQCTQHRNQTEGCSKHGGDFVRLDESMNAALLKAQERKIDRLNIEIGRMEASVGRLHSDFTLLQQQIGRVESDMKKQKQLQKMILSCVLVVIFAVYWFN
ncbi:uncharacterized protein DS421_14g477290 [Arachis hypogaea]|nr:uncharacterized protein DS421_14g477290 [Arachis hypogaea]